MIRHYIDEPASWDKVSGCLIVKGWCFSEDGQAIRAIRMSAGDVYFTGSTGLPRPDVKIAIESAPSIYTGFDVRGIIPPGRHTLRIEIQLGNEHWHSLEAQVVTIKRRWRALWFARSSWTELMFFQMAGHMKHSPRALEQDNLPHSPLWRVSSPRLSVVTPSFQQAKFLPATVRSALQPFDGEMEYRVEDGDSKDGSIEILRITAEEALKSTRRVNFTWTSGPDEGQADAIAKGFAKTSGKPSDIMAWINSDDFYLPGALAFVADYFARHPDVDLIYGHRILVDENSREIGRWFLPTHDDEVLRLYDFVPQETMFWRRRIWDKVGGIDTSFKFAMDWDLLLRFQAAGAKIVRVPYFLACFRIHSAQKTSAQMESVGQKEIDALRLRTFGRVLSPTEIENHPRLLRYLRKSAWIEFLWRRFRIRHR